MNTKSISFNLIISLLLITTIVLCGFGVYGYQMTEKRLNHQQDLNVALTQDRLALSLPVPIWNFETESVGIIIASETKSEHIRGILVKDVNGEVIAGTVKGIDGSVTQHDEAPLVFAKMLSQPLVMLEEGTENAIGHTEIYTSDDYVASFLKAELQKIIIQIVALNAMIILLFSFSLRRITRPLLSLTQAADAISKGNYEIALKAERADEVGQLTQNFDRMRSTVQKKVRDLAELNKSGEVLASSLNRDKALEEVLKNMHDHTHVSMGSVFLFNSDNRLEVKSYYPPKVIDQNKPARSFDPGEGIMGIAAKEKRIVFVSDTSASDNFVDDVSSAAKALLCVPLVDNNIVIGVMNFSGPVDAVTFEESDYEYAASLARSLVTTIKNIQMREVIEEQNRTLEQKVVERTAALQVKTNDISNMLQNMHQGLFTIQADNTIHPEYSRYLEKIYETQDVAGKNFLDLLFAQSDIGSDTLDQVRAAVAVLHESDEFMWECNEHHLIKEVTELLNDERNKHLQLDWDPIFADGLIEKIMVTVRDVTKLKALEKEAEQQKQELTIIGHILNIDRHKFDDFIATSYQFIAGNRQLIESTGEKNPDVIATLFRNMHTIKGNARTFDFSMITHTVHDAENHYDLLRKSDDAPWSQQQLLEELDLVERVVSRYDSIAREKLPVSGVDTLAEDKLLIEKSSTNKLIQLIEQVDRLSIPEQLKNDFGIIKQSLLALDAEPLPESIATVIQSIPSLAEELGKPTPSIEINADTLLINKSASSTLSNIFMHIFRNSLDHGIESAEERGDQGKDPEGHITVTSEIIDEQVTISVHDDGRGLALHKLKEKAIAMSVIRHDDELSPQELAGLIFDSGFSTAESVSKVSGRGVGMDAIRGFMEELGGQIDIELQEQPLSQTAEFCPFELKITLPGDMYILQQ